MKLVERKDGLYLEDILKENIRFSNLAGRMTGSIYDDPDKPKHVMVFWIRDDLELVNTLNQLGLKVKEVNEFDILMRSNNDARKDEVMGNPALMEELQNSFRYSVQFKAYPKVRQNFRTGKEEAYPKVILKTTNKGIRLEPGAFGLIDSAHVDEMSIRFHLWQYNDRDPQAIVAVIDELFCLADESAGEIDEGYLDEKYGYSDEPEELPFN